MNLYPHRSWITPWVIGAFLLTAITGVLMFFHLDRGLNKTAHEWLSWAMIVGVGLHLALNFNAFKRYLSQPIARAIVGAFVLVLAMSFTPAGSSRNEPGFASPVRALAHAPITVLAQVAGISATEVKTRLASAGLEVTGEQQSVADLAGEDLRRQIGILNQVISVAAKP